MENQIAVATQAVTELANQAREVFGRVAGVAQEQLEQVSQQAVKGFDETVALNVRNADAVKQSAEVLVAGGEKAARLLADFARSAIVQGFAVQKSLLAVRSVGELVEVQNAVATAYFQALRSQAEQLSSLSVQVTNDAIAPISASVTESVQSTARALAA